MQGNYRRLNSQAKPYKPPVKLTSYIPSNVFKSSLTSYDNNNFVTYLLTLFGAEVTTQLITSYFIGTAKDWGNTGATTFWQVDINGNIRTGKTMLYNPTTGKRVKEPTPYFNWVHKTINQPEYELKQCLFGEHLLQGNNKPVAIVESEKTAIIASAYLPQLVWVACGMLQGINIDKCKVLQGRQVLLFPDLSKPDAEINCFELWTKKAGELKAIGVHATISDLLEINATESERVEGLDLADYLLKVDYKQIILKQRFKNEFLEYIELTPRLEKQVIDYYIIKMGLKRTLALEAIHELINIHGFIWEK